MGKLTSAGLDGLIPKPGRHSDGQGLFFRTLGLGRAYWVYRYRAGGKEREFSIGPYPAIKLKEAREKHAELRKRVVVDKADPLADKRAAKDKVALAKGKPSFGAVADGYVAAHEASWKNPKHCKQWRMTLTKYCADIRDMPVDEVGTKAVLAVLMPLWTRSPETASRLRGRIEMVLNAARARGMIDENRANPARWKGHLDQLLPNPKKVGKGRGHHAAMAYGDVPGFMATLMAAPGTAAKALMFAILTAARSGEVFGATWDEIDLDRALWVIPQRRMKMGKEHRVPLSDPVLDILRRQLAGRDRNPHVFPGLRPRQPLGVTAFSIIMRRLTGGVFTPHGFRSAFRDWAGDKTNFQREVAEAALAHAVGDETEQAYRRGDALAKRRELMNAWTDYLFPAEEKVVSITTASSKRGR